MNRRKFLTGLAVLAANAITPSCTRELRDSTTPKERLTAGNLYFHDTNTFLSPHEIERVVGVSVSNFREVGIDFKSVAITDGFPELSGLDMMLYFVDNEAEGAWGINSEDAYVTPEFETHKDKNDYEVFQAKIGFPYSPIESKAHTAFVSPDSMVRYAIEKVGNNYTKGDLLRMTAQLTTHELSHGLGAHHVTCESRKEDPDGYFLSHQHPRVPFKFHPRNLAQMEDFIREAQEVLAPQDIIEIREKYLQMQFVPCRK